MVAERRQALARRPREKAREARNRLYREHILEAAERVFARRGFENAKLQEISELAGLSMGTIYSIFSSKEELFAALLDERGEELRELAREIASREIPAREALTALIEGYVGYFVAHPSFLEMHLRLGTSWVLTPKPGSEAQLRHWREIHGHQADIFRRGVAEGVFVDEDPALLAKMFSAIDQAVLADWAEGGMKAGEDELVRRLKDAADRAFARRRAK